MTGKQLEAAIKLDKRSATEIADLFEISRSQLYDLFKKTERLDEYYIKMAKKIGLSIPEIALETPKPVPYYDIDATAGNVTIFNEDRTEYIKQYLSVPAFSDCDMYISISGNSMYPKYCSGELVALKKIHDLEIVAFGEAYVIVTKEQRFLKYVTKGSTAEKWKLKSENEADYEDFEIPIKKVLHLYIVKGKITKNIL